MEEINPSISKPTMEIENERFNLWKPEKSEIQWTIAKEDRGVRRAWFLHLVIPKEVLEGLKYF